MQEGGESYFPLERIHTTTSKKDDPMKRISLLWLIIFAVGLAGSVAHADDSWMLYDDSQVATIDISVDPAAVLWLYENPHSDTLFECQVHFSNAYIDETVEEVGFGIRGNTSRDAAKKSFKLSFNDFVPGREFYDVDKMNLNGEHNDPSIIRSKLCWDLYQKIGMKASRAAHAAVYINDVYYGLYISVEHIDDEFLDKEFADDSGNLWKCLWPADLVYLGDNPELYKMMEGDRRVYDLKTNEDEDDYSQLARLIDIINNVPNSQLPDSLESILVVPAFLKYMAMDVLTGSWDDYWFLKNNYYIYHEPSSGQFHWIPYDYDNTYGIDWFNEDWATVDPYIFNSYESRPLVERMRGWSQYRNLYTHFLEFYRDQVYDLALWEDEIDALKDMITPWAEADTFRTLDYGFTMTDFHNSYSASGYQNQHVKRGLKEFIIARTNSLEGELNYYTADPIVYDASWQPTIPQPGESVPVSAAVFSHAGISQVSISFWPEGTSSPESYAMSFDPLPGTTRVEEADRWVGTIPAPDASSGEFQIVATDVNGETMTYPRTQRLTIQWGTLDEFDLVINEFLASNAETNGDEMGEYDDWVEIYNVGTETVLLSGMYLTDDPDNLTRWQFPMGGIMLAPGDFLLVWCDDEEQGAFHTSFKLDADGEFVALVSSDGVSVIDSLSFGEQETDVAFGRYPDGGTDWMTLVPTPEASNVPLQIEDETVDFSARLAVYPNPFTAQTTIHFQLATRSPVQVEIFDVAGRQVWSHQPGWQEAGAHAITWDGRNQQGQAVDSGVYLCRLQTAAREMVRKIVVVR